MTKLDRKVAVRHLTDDEFLRALRAANGLYTQTAKYITTAYKIPYTRQAVHDRAKNFEEELADIKESSLDNAEDTLFKLFKSRNPRVRLQAVTWYLRKAGALRGYSDTLDINLSKSVKVVVDEEAPPDWLTDTPVPEN